MEARSLNNPNIHLLNLATHTWSLIDREASCQYWCLTPENQGILNCSPHFDAPVIPAGNRLEDTLCKGEEDFCFRLPLGRLDEHVLQITVQNHGYAVVADSLPDGVEVTRTSLFDGSVEGIAAPDLRASSVQYHPEARPGPHDAAYLFAAFRERVAA